MMCADLANAASTSPREKAVAIEDIVVHPQIAFGVHLRRARLQGREWIGDRFEHRVIDFHFVGGLARMEGSVRHHHGQKISNAAGGFADRHENRQVGIVEARAALPREHRRR